MHVRCGRRTWLKATGIRTITLPIASAIEGAAANSLSPQSLVTTPGLKYAGVNLYAFQPVGSAARAVGASGYIGVYPAELSATWPGNSNFT